MKKIISFLLFILLALPFGYAHGSGAWLIGDCDGNGELQAADATRILRHIVNLERLSSEGWYAADANRNGEIDANDAASVLRHVVRLQRISGELTNLPPMISNLRLSVIEAELMPGKELEVTVSFDSNGAVPDLSLYCSNETVVSASLSGSSLTIRALTACEATVSLSDRVSHCYAKTRIVVGEFDPALYSQITTGLYSSEFDTPDDPLAMSLYQYIVSLDPSAPSTQIIFAGLRLMGTAYNVLDCSNYTRQAYADAGYGSLIVAGSDNQIRKFRNDGCLNDFPFTSTGGFDCVGMKPAYVFLWVDSRGEGNHSALYLGNINGVDWILESATSIGGVGIRRLWTTGTWQLKYFANPLDK